MATQVLADVSQVDSFNSESSDFLVVIDGKVKRVPGDHTDMYSHLAIHQLCLVDPTKTVVIAPGIIPSGTKIKAKNATGSQKSYTINGTQTFSVSAGATSTIVVSSTARYSFDAGFSFEVEGYTSVNAIKEDLQAMKEDLEGVSALIGSGVTD